MRQNKQFENITLGCRIFWWTMFHTVSVWFYSAVFLPPSTRGCPCWLWDIISCMGSRSSWRNPSLSSPSIQASRRIARAAMTMAITTMMSLRYPWKRTSKDPPPPLTLCLPSSNGSWSLRRGPNPSSLMCPRRCSMTAFPVCDGDKRIPLTFFLFLNWVYFTQCHPTLIWCTLIIHLLCDWSPHIDQYCQPLTSNDSNDRF